MDNKEFNIDNLRQQSNPFTVPQGYFDRQQEQLLAIAASRRNRSIIPMLVSAAATVAIIATVGIFKLNSREKAPDLDSYIASLSDAELTNSIELDDLDTYSEFAILENY